MNGLKEAFSRENLLKNLNFFVLLNLGLVLTAVGIVYFKNPNHFAFGGTSGLSILLADLFPRINVGGFMWIINLVLVVLGFIFLGIKCMGWTIYSSFALSFFVSCCEWLYPSGVSLSGDAMLDLVFAVFLPALGAAIVFDIGASTGGTDIVALILAKYTSMEIGKALMVSDILSDRRDHLFRGQIALVGLVAAEAEVVVGRDEQRLTDVDHGDHADALDRRRRADRRFPRHGHAHRAALARNARKRRAARRDHQIICVQIDRKITRLAADAAGRNNNMYPCLSRAAHGVSRGLRDLVLRRKRRAVEIERDQFDFIHMPFPFFLYAARSACRTDDRLSRACVCGSTIFFHTISEYRSSQ